MNNEQSEHLEGLSDVYRLLAGRFSIAIWISALVLIAGALYFAKSVALPMTLALLLYLALRPVICRLNRWRLSPWVSAFLVMAVVAGAILAIAYSVATPAQYWIVQGPRKLPIVADKLEGIQNPLHIFAHAEQEIEQLTEAEGADEPLEVEVEAPSVLDQSVMVNTTLRLIALLGGVILFTIFLLAKGDEFLNRLMMVLPTFSSQRNAVELIHEVQSSVGRYLGTITLINFGLGCCVTLVMWLLDMPTPVLWGVMAMLFNYVPYLGAYVGTGVVFFAGAVDYPTLGQALVAALAYLTVTSIEGNFVTPNVLGKTLRLDPVIVLLALTFWGFMWGLAGVILAVPILIVVKLFCGHFESTKPIAVLLGDKHLIEEEHEDAPAVEPTGHPADRVTA